MDRIIAERATLSAVRRELVEGPPLSSASSGRAEYLEKALYSRAPDRIDVGIEAQTALLRDLCDTMKYGSLCALGGFTPYPVLSALDHFPEDFGVPAPMPNAAE